MSDFEFDESLFKRSTPWAACAALEEFFSRGARCHASDAINWVGAASICARMANSIPVDLPDAAQVLGWAHLAIAINESLGGLGCIGHAMTVRINMIRRFGDQPGDRICDAKRVVDFCMSLPEVTRLLQLETPPRAVLDIAPDARVAAQMLKDLQAAGKLQPIGDIARLLGIVEEAQKQPWQAAESVKALLKNRPSQ